MARLIIVVTRAGVIDVRQAVKREPAIALELVPVYRGLRHPGAFLVVLVSFCSGHRIDETAASGELLNSGVQETAEHSVLEGLMEVADLPHFVANIALLDALRESAEGLGRGVAGPQSF